MLRAVIAALAICLPTKALADPCEAISANRPLPSYLGFGETFSGPVVHVIDGDSLCVAVGPGHENWVEVRLADFWASESKQAGGPAARAALERIALGKEAVCVANLSTYDRIAALCSIDGRSIGDQMRTAGIHGGGNGRRIRAAASGSIQTKQALDPAFHNCREARAVGAAPMGQP